MTTQPNDQGMTFDSAPVSQATVVNPSTVAVAGGMTFDAAPTPTPISISAPTVGTAQKSAQQPAQSQPAPTAATVSATPGSMPSDPFAAKLSLWAQNVQSDLMHGTSLTGVGHVLKALGAHGLASGTSEGVAKFMGSLPLGLLRATQGGAETAQPGQRWQGAKDVAGGLLDASQIPGAFIAPEGAEATAAGLGRAEDAIASQASKAGEAVGKAANAVKKSFSLKAVQQALEGSKESIQQALQSNLESIQNGWHDSVRDLFDQVAQDADVKPEPAESLRDVAANIANAVKSKASAMYKKLDQTMGNGGRFQAYDEQLSNVKRALRNDTGVDHDLTGRLIERINELEDAKAKALDQAKAAGVDPKLIDQANAAWRQASALEDLSKHIQNSVSGLRGDLANGVRAVPESLSPAKLAPRANRLYNTGRLQQAVGEDHADKLLQAIETTKQAAQDAAENAARQTEAATTKAAQKTAAVRRNQVIGGAVAASAGVPTVGTWLRHLLGE